MAKEKNALPEDSFHLSLKTTRAVKFSLASQRFSENNSTLQEFVFRCSSSPLPASCSGKIGSAGFQERNNTFHVKADTPPTPYDLVMGYNCYPSFE